MTRGRRHHPTSSHRRANKARKRTVISNRFPLLSSLYRPSQSKLEENVDTFATDLTRHRLLCGLDQRYQCGFEILVEEVVKGNKPSPTFKQDSFAR
ncbi:unnamed protein product, partial [Dovyalis caffra]